MSTFIKNNRHRIYFYTGLMFLGITFLLFKRNGEGILVFIYLISSLFSYLPLKFFHEGAKTPRASSSPNNSRSLITIAIFIAISFGGLFLAVLFEKPFFVHFFAFIIFVTTEIILWKMEIDSKRRPPTSSNQ